MLKGITESGSGKADAPGGFMPTPLPATKEFTIGPPPKGPPPPGTPRVTLYEISGDRFATQRSSWELAGVPKLQKSMILDLNVDFMKIIDFMT